MVKRFDRLVACLYGLFSIKSHDLSVKSFSEITWQIKNISHVKLKNHMTCGYQNHMSKPNDMWLPSYGYQTTISFIMF